MIIKILQDIGVLYVGGWLLPKLGAWGETALGIIFLVIIIKWVLYFKDSEKMCLSCKKMIGRREKSCPHCGSKEISTVGQLKESSQREKERKEKASSRYAYLSSAQFCKACDKDYSSSVNYCMTCGARTEPLARGKIYEIMWGEFPDLLNDEKDLDSFKK